ncbi:MAG: Gfo/Idh/MocA family oxidoreductase [Ktedonobacteraceae bacterium]
MANEQKERIVLVGCGGMSTAWLSAAQQDAHVEIVGLVDIVEEAARKRAKEFGLEYALIGTNLETVLKQTKPDIVFNCTIPEAHYDVIMQAIKNGCHVLSEKPLADSIEQAQVIVEAAQRAGKTVAVMQNRRYDQNIRRIRHFLEAESIGALTTVNSDFYLGPHFGGFRDHMKHVLLLDMAIHSFDAARLLTGADPISVYCKEWNPKGSWYDHDASAIAIFEMTNDIVYTYRGSWCAEGLPTSAECDWRFVGQRGSALWDGGVQQSAQRAEPSQRFLSFYHDVAIPEHQTQAIGGHAGLIQDFLTCIREGTSPETNVADNIKSLAMVFGAIESAEKGQAVKITW